MKAFAVQQKWQHFLTKQDLPAQRYYALLDALEWIWKMTPLVCMWQNYNLHSIKWHELLMWNPESILNSPCFGIIVVEKLKALSTRVRCSKSFSCLALSLGTYGNRYARPSTAMKRSSSMLKKTPAISLRNHSFGSDPNVRPRS